MSTPQKTSQSVSFETFTRDNAPSGSVAAMNRLKSAFGKIPNLAAAMAASPALLEGFTTLREINIEHSGLSDIEKELLYLTNATANGCPYCQAVHSTFANHKGVSQDTIDKIRAEEPLDDPRQDTLVSFARSVVKNRGRVESGEIQQFLAAGFEKSNVLDVVACLAQSVMANYSNHIANVEPDEIIKPQYRPAGV